MATSVDVMATGLITGEGQGAGRAQRGQGVGRGRGQRPRGRGQRGRGQGVGMGRGQEGAGDQPTLPISHPPLQKVIHETNLCHLALCWYIYPYTLFSVTLIGRLTTAGGKRCMAGTGGKLVPGCLNPPARD